LLETAELDLELGLVGDRWAKRGLKAWVVRPGTIRVGDEICRC
jgi:hypothetical protein